MAWFVIFVVWPLGSRILRAQGRAAWRQFGEAIQAGRPPANEALNGALVLTGGILLMVPGFITDVIGLLLLIPPTRAVARNLVIRHHRSAWIGRAANLGSGFGRNRGNSGGNGNGNGQQYDADATAVDIDGPELNP